MSERSEAIRREARQAGRPRLSVVWMIYAREMLDQFRDRRTLFTIAILPILLYPIVGMLLMQIAQFTQQHPTSICVVGTDHLTPDVPPLVEKGEEDGFQFAESLTTNHDRLALFTYKWGDVQDGSFDRDQDTVVSETTKGWVRDGVFDVGVGYPLGFCRQPVQRLRFTTACSIAVQRRVGSIHGRT